MSRQLWEFDSCQQNDEFYAIMGKHFASLDIAKELESQLYNKENSVWYLIVDESETPLRVIGFAAIYVTSKHYFLDNLYVFPEFRGQGVAKQLVKSIVEGFTDMPIKCIAVNPYALKVFNDFGFEEVGQNGKYKKLIKHQATVLPL